MIISRYAKPAHGQTVEVRGGHEMEERFYCYAKCDGIEGIQILSSLWRESVIQSQCDSAVERINIIEISQSVYDLLLGRHFYLNGTF